jgi:hypothetical protein
MHAQGRGKCGMQCWEVLLQVYEPNMEASRSLLVRLTSDTLTPDTWIIDTGATHHITASRAPGELKASSVDLRTADNTGKHGVADFDSACDLVSVCSGLSTQPGKDVFENHFRQ